MKQILDRLRNWRYMKQFVLLSKEEAAEIADLLEGKIDKEEAMSDKLDAKALQRLYERAGRLLNADWQIVEREIPVNDLGKEKGLNPLVELTIHSVGNHPQSKSPDPVITTATGPYHTPNSNVWMSREVAEFIVGMRNAFPAILAHIESQEKLNRDLSRYWLKKYKDQEEAANNKAADLQRENAALREQDELHWKTRKTLVAENAALKQELAALRESIRERVNCTECRIEYTCGQHRLPPDTPPEPQRSREREELLEIICQWGLRVDFPRNHLGGLEMLADALIAAGWGRK